MYTVPDGIMQCPVTPFTEDNRVDLDTYEKVINFHIEQRTTTLCVVLHLAESLNLIIEERKEMAALAIKTADGRVPVMVHASMPGTDQTIDLARHAQEIGAEAVCVTTPYYWRPPDEALYEHFVAVGSAIDIALIGYSSPALQGGIGIDPQLLVRLIDRLDNFVGLKEASHSFESFIEARRATQAVRPDFAVFPGVEYVLPTMAVGGRASMSTIGGVAPRMVQRLYNLVAEGRYEEARELQDRVSHLWTLFKVEYPAPIKAAMEIMGRPVGPTRLPIRPLDRDAKERLRGELDRLGILDSEPYGWDGAQTAVTSHATDATGEPDTTTAS